MRRAATESSLRRVPLQSFGGLAMLRLRTPMINGFEIEAPSSAPLLLAEGNRRVEKLKMVRSSFHPSAAEALRVRTGPNAMGFERASRRWSIATIISYFAWGGNARTQEKPGLCEARA